MALGSGCALGALLAAAPAIAAGTIAGTSIKNSATATYDLPAGGSGSTTSNEISIIVDELLDVSVASTNGGDVSVFPNNTNQLLTFQVTNAGNGSEAFALVADDNAGGDDYDPTTTSIVIDSNGNGVYDPGIDTVYVPGSNDPVLAPDQTLTAFILSSIPGAATNGQRGRVNLTATALTGSGAPGTSFAGQGQGGADAVVGATGADGHDGGYYAVSAATVSFIKSAVVTDPFGGTTEVPGSIITYSLVATIAGSGNLANIQVTDAIPAGTTYEAGSLALESSALTDSSDADAGEFAGGGLTVRLGTVPAGATRTVTFQVKIN